MLSRLSFANPAARGPTTTCRLLPMTALALATALATACAERPAAPGAASRSAPASTPTNQDGARAGAHEGTVMAEDDHAAHAPAATSSPTLPAAPWPSDAPLREGMRRMHRAVEALGHAEHDHLDAAQITAAAQQVEDAANYMITNCKLPPEPDAALHGVLATLLTGAAALKREPSNTAPVAAMRDALAMYPRMFADPAWPADIVASK